VACHFEDVPGADRARLERRLSWLRKVAVRGRGDGVEDGRVALRGCCLLDGVEKTRLVAAAGRLTALQ
jgi:hypothetical protein